MREPTVLDYVKSRLTFGKGKRSAVIKMPPYEKTAEQRKQSHVGEEPKPEPVNRLILPPEGKPGSVNLVIDPQPAREESAPAGIPWLALGALILALCAQWMLEPPRRASLTAFILYGLCAALLVIGFLIREIRLAPPRPPMSVENRPLRLEFLLFGLVAGLLAFILFGNDEFTWLNFGIWMLAILLTLLAFWSNPLATLRARWRWIRSGVFPKVSWRKLLPVTLVVLLLSGAILFMRLYRLDQVPPEMVSDHAEKLLDVLDVMNGQTPVYFARNTGREFFQFYWTALVIKLFKTGVSFFSLKLGTVLLGLLTLPYIYLLGKEYASRRVGLLAFAFAGLAYWPNVISRLGLRFPLYPLFVAPLLFYLLRGLRRQSRNDFIWAGLALGIGLHGYTSYRIVPILVVLGIILFILHRQSVQARRMALTGLTVVTLVSLVVFIPLFRYAVNYPEMFVYRTFSRVGTIEQALPGPAWQIFLKNFWNAITMLNYSDGEIWVHSVTFRPALDLIGAALFLLGVILLIIRYSSRRDWQDLFLLVSIPVLMMPSILSLAFPAENPSLNRTAGAIVPVFLLVALALDALMGSIAARFKGNGGKWAVNALAGILIILSGYQNYNLVFKQYYPVYLRSTWNTSEMGQVIQEFVRDGGEYNHAWLVGYPYWVDSRAIGFTAGYPGHDFAIWPEQFKDTLPLSNPKLFIVNIQDSNAITLLSELYPGGELSTYHSKVDTKDYLLYQVP